MSVHSLDPNQTGMPVWRLPVPWLIAALTVAALMLWPFWDGLQQLWGDWLDSPEYSHGFLIPPVAAFLVWQRKDQLERMDFVGSWWGLAVVVLGGVMLALGQLGTVYVLVQYAYVVTLSGLTLSFLGWRAFRLVAVPLVILTFMIPLPQFVLANLSTKLQLLSSQLGVLVIRAFDISVFLEGNVIDLGGYKLQVADACSGLRYLFPLMTLGFLMGYFYKGSTWKRAVLFLSSVPITVLMNSTRIGIIGVTVDRWGTAMAEGFLHEFQGWMIFMLSAFLMLGEIAVLNRIGHEAGTWRQLFGVEFPAPTPRGGPVRRRRPPASFIAGCIALLALIAVTEVVPRPAEVYPQRIALDKFPLEIGEFTGRRETLEGVYLETLNLTDYLLADYSDGRQGPINLYIAYYDSQRKGEAVHSPRSCLPGGGWQLREFGQRTLPGVTIDGRPLRVNRTLIELGDDRQLVYYWFQQRGRSITNEFAVKWYLFRDALTRNRTDGALVRVIVPLPRGSDEAEAERRLADFTARIAPALTRYLPD